MDVLLNWTPRMITVAMAAKELGISIPRVHQLITNKRLTPVLQAGKTYLLDSEEVKKLKEIDRPTGRPTKAAVEQRAKAALTADDIAGLADRNLGHPTKEAQPAKKTRAALTIDDIRGLADKNLGKTAK